MFLIFPYVYILGCLCMNQVLVRCSMCADSMCVVFSREEFKVFKQFQIIALLHYIYKIKNSHYFLDVCTTCTTCSWHCKILIYCTYSAPVIITHQSDLIIYLKHSVVLMLFLPNICVFYYFVKLLFCLFIFFKHCFADRTVPPCIQHPWTPFLVKITVMSIQGKLHTLWFYLALNVMHRPYIFWVLSDLVQILDLRAQSVWMQIFQLSALSSFVTKNTFSSFLGASSCC